MLRTVARSWRTASFLLLSLVALGVPAQRLDAATPLELPGAHRPDAHLPAEMQPALASGNEAVDEGLGWTQGYTLILLEEGADLHNARRWIQARGGRVAVMMPPRVMLGWIPEELDSRLVGHAGIRSVHRHTPPSETEVADAASRAAVHSFARIVEGRLPEREPAKPDQPLPLPPGSDAFDRGTLSTFEVMQNLRQNDLGALWKLGGEEALTANSDYMVGTVTVSLFFVESDGSGSDPDQFDWTASAEQTIFDEAVAGLSWWSDQASQHADCWVTFLVQAHFATQDARCAQPLEPVLHDSATYAGIVADVLQNFGYGSGSHLSRATAYNTAQKLNNQTDWAYSAFIAANPTGTTQFTDGFSAWAFLGGPYVSLLQRSFSWQFRRVFAHESGHIFGACDEYHVEGYGGCNGCGACWTSGVDNGNCEECNPNSVPCMMKQNTWNLCGWTPGQVGWWRSPCTSGPLPPPVVDSMTPNVMWHAQAGVLELHGEYFNYGTSIDLGDGVLVQEVTWVSSELLQISVAVDPESAPGMRDLVVTGPDGGSTTAASAFEVRPTTVHYVSQYGSATFPYDTPLVASNDLAAVLAVASNGDTLRLIGGTWGPLQVQKSLVIEGGWANDFGSRLPAALPTIFEATQGSVLRITGATTQPVLDGLVFRGGRGTAISSPELGTTSSGGGVLSLDAAPLFRNCIIEDNRVGSSSQHGAGGGAFLYRSHATFEDCTFRNNKAGDGGALYVLDGEVTLRDCRFETNVLEPLWGTGGGAAIRLHTSTASSQGDVFTGNVGAVQGGAVHLSGPSQFTATGTTFDAHQVTGNGAGVWSQGSHLTLSGCTFLHNVSGNLGGGLYAQAGTLVIRSSLFAANEASTLGGGLYTDGNAPDLENLSMTGNVGGPAAGLYLTNVQPGARVTNSVLAFNTLGAVIFASGTPPTVDWNLYWENGGLDVLGTTMGANDLMQDPRWVDAAGFDVHPTRHAPILDTGDPARLDPDGSRSDRGATGGPAGLSQAPAWTKGLVSQPTRVGTRLTWDPSQSTQISSYLVYRGDSADFQPTASTFVQEIPAPTTTWEDVQPPGNSWYKVCAIDAQQRCGGFGPAVAAQQPTDATSNRHRLELEPVTPNPTNPSATIRFTLPQDMDVRVTVYDARGRRIRRLTSGMHPAGEHRLSWDGRTDDGVAAASGVYWIRMHTSQKAFARKLILVR